MGLILVLCMGWLLWRVVFAPVDHQALRRAEQALQSQQTERAFELIRAQLRRSPNDPLWQLLLAEAELSVGNVDRAEGLLSSVSHSSPDVAFRSAWVRARIDLALGRSEHAEAGLRILAEDLERGARARSLLAAWWHQQGDFQAARELALEAMNLSDRDWRSMLLASGTRQLLPASQTSEFRDSDRTTLLRRVEAMREAGQIAATADILRNMIATTPAHAALQGWSGEILADQQSPGFAAWHLALPEEIRESAEIWFARGKAAEVAGEFDKAVASYAAAWLADETQSQPLKEIWKICWRLLSVAAASSDVEQVLDATASASDRLLGLLFQTETGDRLERVHQVATTVQAVQEMLREQLQTPDRSLASTLAERLELLGRHAEAAAWRAWQAASPDAPLPVPNRRRRVKIVAASPSAPAKLQAVREFCQLLTSQTPPLSDWDHFEFPDAGQSSTLPASGIRLRDVAREQGLEFRYDNGGEAALLLGHLFETTGGGVGVFDFDLDGWPDLYLAQGGDWKDPDSPRSSTGVLVRNRAGAVMEDVTVQAALFPAEFGQGVCCGDFNQDGFPDLYLCQLGGNRLFLNNGDGTFTDVTDESGTGGGDWSLSGAWGDLNGDGLPDLYVTRYLDEVAVRTQVCLQGVEPRGCPPRQFAGVADLLYLNRGDGTFTEIVKLSGIGGIPGKGMGVVLGRLTQAADNPLALQIYVSNDGEPNFLFEHASQRAGGLPTFVERAIVRGVATDHRGQNQASMGVAVADVDGDGRLDLLVTNFYEELNALYLQREEGLFEDVSAARLAESRLQLGFGTQFLDVNLDGWPDLFVVNGHVDRATVTGEPDHMPPQLFINRGAGELQLLRERVFGAQYGDPQLGRGVAVLDWNRDGRPDVAVTHLDRPFALLMNETANAGHCLQVQLIGVQSSRDPVGTQVTLRTAERTHTQQLLGGGGYLVTNEPLLTFGLGGAEHVDELRVEWASGAVHTVNDVPAGVRLLLIEGREPLLLPLEAR